MKLNYLTVGLMVILVVTSCNKDEGSNPDPITEANITGSVNLYDEGITQIDNEGMTVMIEGISPVISAITDMNGEFTLPDVPFGTHTIVYEKSGFGTFKKIWFEHTNTGSSTIIKNTPSLGQISSTKITGLVANVEGNAVVLSITTNPSGNTANTLYVRYYLNTNSIVDKENYTYYSPGLVSQINPYKVKLTVKDLLNIGFSSGETVYAKAYGDSYWSNEYNDPDLGKKVFPNLNTTSANTVSFVVP